MIFIKTYYTSGNLMEYLGITRDALRFYKEKGLLKPYVNEVNNYTQYTFMDIYRVMAIDFFRKRSFSIKEISDVMSKSNIEDIHALLLNKRQELVQLITEAEKKLRRIEESIMLISDLELKVNVFSIRWMPSFHIKGELKAFDSVEDYNGVAHDFDNDMFTLLIRMITFGQGGIKEPKILVSEGLDEPENSKQKCIYTMVEEVLPRDKDQDLDEIMYRLTNEFAKANRLRLLGTAYSRIVMVTFEEDVSRSIIEIFVPFENIEG